MRIAPSLVVAAALAVQAAQASPPGADRLQSAEATGQAPISGDLLAARGAAKDDALRGCVQQVAAALVTAASEPDQVRLLSEKIYARSVDYIRRFQILDDRQDANAWVTRVRCDVSESKLVEDLLASGVAHRRAGMPRVLVLLAEQPIGAAQPTGWWQGGGDGAPGAVERAFTDRMEKSGFTVLGAGALQGKGKLAGTGADPTIQQARELGAMAGAEVVVVGRAVAKPLGELPIDGGAFHSAAARLTARAVRTDTGEVIATSEFTSAPGRGFELAAAGRDALAEAGRQLAREAFSRVGRIWSRDGSGVRQIVLGVTGVEEYGRLAAFKNVLAQSVPGVQNVQERSIGEGRAELSVTLAGTSRSLATDLATRKLPGFGVKVRSVTDAAVEVELR